MDNPFLVVGGTLSAIAALLHFGCIVFGASWYRFFGASDRIVRLADAGSIAPAILTACIALGLVVWSLFAFSGAGVIPRLPLRRAALCSITAVYLVRGLTGLAFATYAPGIRGAAFWWCSSIICMGIGALHLLGTQQAWPSL